MTAFRLAWLRLHQDARAFLLAQPRRHAAHDAVAKPDRLCHHVTLWYGDACGPVAACAADFPAGAQLLARPLGVASDDRVEALVVEVAGHRFQHGSRRTLHITLSVAAGVDAQDSVRLLRDPPPLAAVDWAQLPGVVEYVLPSPAPARC